MSFHVLESLPLLSIEHNNSVADRGSPVGAPTPFGDGLPTSETGAFREKYLLKQKISSGWGARSRQCN